jgi:hypothetical protein
MGGCIPLQSRDAPVLADMLTPTPLKKKRLL